jgi:hypothetical protein
MSIQDERDLRARLSVLLDGVEPRLAPVPQVVRRGRGIRMRRWISVAAGLAMVAAGAALVPGLLQTHRVAPMTQLRYKVTVMTLGPTAEHGVVAAGTIGTKRWRVVVSNSGGDSGPGDGCALQRYLLTCGLAYGGRLGPRQVGLNQASEYGTQYEIGTVGAAVTRVAVRLTNGTVLNLRPVQAGGVRWIGVAAPLGAITRAVSFVGRSEYEYAVPFGNNGAAEFVTWLRPGQAGLPVASKSVGRGEYDGVAWRAAVHAGPWGYCASFANGSTCVPATGAPSLLSDGRIVAPLACGPLDTSDGKATGASAGVTAVPPGVKNVVLLFANRSRLRLTAVAIAGTRVLGYAIPARPKVVRTLEYGVHGQLLHSASVPGWGC